LSCGRDGKISANLAMTFIVFTFPWDGCVEGQNYEFDGGKSVYAF
jgi:hypothetical protein